MLNLHVGGGGEWMLHSRYESHCFHLWWELRAICDCGCGKQRHNCISEIKHENVAIFYLIFHLGFNYNLRTAISGKISGKCLPLVVNVSLMDCCGFSHCLSSLRYTSLLRMNISQTLISHSPTRPRLPESLKLLFYRVLWVHVVVAL